MWGSSIFIYAEVVQVRGEDEIINIHLRSSVQSATITSSISSNCFDDAIRVCIIPSTLPMPSALNSTRCIQIRWRFYLVNRTINKVQTMRTPDASHKMLGLRLWKYFNNSLASSCSRVCTNHTHFFFFKYLSGGEFRTIAYPLIDFFIILSLNREIWFEWHLLGPWKRVCDAFSRLLCASVSVAEGERENLSETTFTANERTVGS